MDSKFDYFIDYCFAKVSRNFTQSCYDKYYL